MLKLRLNRYAMTSKFEEKLGITTPINIVYFHGFTMHDQNYDIAALLLLKGLIAYQASDSNPSEPSVPLYSNYQELINTHLHGVVPITSNLAGSSFITISLDYQTGTQVDDLAQALQQALGNRATYIFAFSYGVLNAQMILDYFAQITPNTLELVKQAHAIHGSFVPSDDKISIPLETAIQTAKLWSPTSLVSFGRLIGLPKVALQELKARSKQISPVVLAGQQASLLHYNEQIAYFTQIMAKPVVMSKWQDLQIATNDQIFPVANLERLATYLQLPTYQVAGPHYFDPVQLYSLLVDRHYYE